ncbi:S8 family peptidase [Anaeromicropila populeti]|uniref:Subtilase family protein n=1 Tax=Anaeromicropila populeti TaxID=37658 RepID=A0A1I6J0H4_9FIRM|nr:S8 family peptidase [Anaeromicropila populeti]SFR72515.1 Subtilase family protein [Anaeromicropila populeti]
MIQNCGDAIISEDYADFIVELENIPERLRENYDFCSNNVNDNYSIAYTPIATLPENLIHLYTYSIYPRCFGLLDTGALEDSGVARIQQIPALNLTGQDVLIGIIDTGIDYTHEAFINPDGTTRIASIWDQTIQSESAFPENLFYGTEYTKEQINLALASEDPFSIVPSTDDNGHGTFLAGIAAGNPSKANDFSGIATSAELVIVKLKPAKKYLRDFFYIPEDAVCYQENDIMFGIKYLVQTARNLSRPISICIGIGSSQGSHDSRNPLSIYLSAVSDQVGIGISIAAGNEGNSGHHYSGTINEDPGYDTVELNIGANTNGFSMELWGNSPNSFFIDILSPDGEYIPRIPARLKETRRLSFIFAPTIIFVDYEVIESQTGDVLILIRFQNPTEGIWRFRVYSTTNYNPYFHIWLPITNFLSTSTFFTKPDPNTTLTSPANTIYPVVATAYDYTNQSLYINASRGYTRTNVISPSFAAPGVNLIGPDLNNTYTRRTGTSIAAAFSAGTVAMFLEWGIVRKNQPQMDTLQIKNFLIRGARRDDSMTYPNQQWGYGTLDVYNSFNRLRE